jgi:hypothetical protein
MIKQRIQLAIASLLILLSGGLALSPAMAGAASLKGDACNGINQLDNGSNSTTCSSAGGQSIHNIIVAVLDILSVIVGFIAVIMLVIAGLRFITAGGDSSAVAQARGTIIYALVGLIIVVSAQVIVHFVLNKL